MKGQYGLLAISPSHYTILSYAAVHTVQPAWSTQKGWSRQGLSPQALVGVPARGEGTLTGQNGGHEGGKHEEEHGEEQEAGVAQDLLGFIPDAQVQQANEEADPDV